MARPLFEQYKDALRRGHVALLSDEFEAALAAYAEAAALVPDRPLPYASIGGVLARLGRTAEALEAYDRAIALGSDDPSVATARTAVRASVEASAPTEAAPIDRAPSEPEPNEPEPIEPEPSAPARAEPAALSRGMESEIAERADIVAIASGQPSGAEIAAVDRDSQAAGESAPSTSSPAPGVEGAASEPSTVQEVTLRAAAVREAVELEAAERAAVARAVAVHAADADAAAMEALRAAFVPESQEGDAAEPASSGLREGAPADPVAVDPATLWPAIDLPSPPPAPLVGPPPDPASLQEDADRLVDAGDSRAARDVLLLAASVHRDAGRLDAAIDSCLQLLALAPGDPRVHLAITNLQLDRGWRSVATEKIELLLRLTSLSGDAQAEADVHLLAAERLRDESPTRLDARRRGLPAT